MTYRVALLADIRGWAFDINLQALARYLNREMWDPEILYVSEVESWPDLHEFDVVYVTFHRWDSIDDRIPWDRAVGSLRSAMLDPQHPGAVRPDDRFRVTRCRAFHAVSMQAWRCLRNAGLEVDYLTNPVDTRMFLYDALPTRTNLIAQWNGNARHGGGVVKGLPETANACALAGVTLNVAEFATRRDVTEMAAHYRSADVALCASRYEGASNSVMEAMACGLALITTECGNISELQGSQLAHYGDSGIEVVEREDRAIAAALEKMKSDLYRVRTMGRLNALEIEERWSWHAWIHRYEAFLKKALP